MLTQTCVPLRPSLECRPTSAMKSGQPQCISNSPTIRNMMALCPDMRLNPKLLHPDPFVIVPKTSAARIISLLSNDCRNLAPLPAVRRGAKTQRTTMNEMKASVKTIKIIPSRRGRKRARNVLTRSPKLTIMTTKRYACQGSGVYCQEQSIISMSVIQRGRIPCTLTFGLLITIRPCKVRPRMYAAAANPAVHEMDESQPVQSCQAGIYRWRRRRTYLRDSWPTSEDSAVRIQMPN